MRGIYTYKITLSNTTSTATPAGLQVRLNINFASLVSNINADLGNIRFSSDQAGNNLLYAWLESAPQGTFTQGSSVSLYTSSNVWVNLGNNIIPANGSLTIYMQVLSSGTEFDGVYWGANPLWTGTYGQYDNGANVFNNYWNFAGTSLPSGWIGSGEDINNGLSFPYPSYAYTSAVYGLSPSMIVDFYGNFPPATSTVNAAFGFVEYNTGNAGIDAAWTINEFNNQGGTTDAIGQTAISSSSFTTGISGGVQTTGYNVYSIYFPSTSEVVFSYNYNTGTTFTTTIPTSQYPIGGVNYQGLQTTIGPFFWLRTRVYPPNGTDPVLTSIQILLLSNYTSASIPVPEWSVLRGKPYITISGKGIVNGLSNIPNNGADFGPDTLLGASSPNQYGPPYTQTSGLQEAWDYSVATSVVNPVSGDYTVLPLYIIDNIVISSPVTFSGYGKIIENPQLKGQSSMSPYIYCETNNAYTITYDPSSFNYTTIRIENMQPLPVSGFTPYGFINIDFSSSPHLRSCLLEMYNIVISGNGFTVAPLYIVDTANILMFNYENYGTTGTYSGGYFETPAMISVVDSYIAGNPTFTGDSLAYLYGLYIVNTGFETGGLTLGGGPNGVNSVWMVNSPGIIYLNGNVNQIGIYGMTETYPSTPLINVLTSGDSWTIGYLIINGMNINNSQINPYSIAGAGVTVNNWDISNVVSNVPVQYPPAPVPTTPAIPASGTAQQNTNPYPVNVYIYGGTVTAIDYTPVGRTATQVGTSGPATVRLNPSDSITLTYSAAPTWVWMKA
ncbi:MAG: hypothetical protein QXU98_14320 [Candidatus Parvarchaeota archaeon]